MHAKFLTLLSTYPHYQQVKIKPNILDVSLPHKTAFSKFSQSLFDIKCLGKAQYILFTLSYVLLLLLWVEFSLIIKSTWNLMWMKTRLWETDSQFLQWHTLYFGKTLNLTNQYVVKKKQYKPLNTPYFYCTVPQNK